MRYKLKKQFFKPFNSNTEGIMKKYSLMLCMFLVFAFAAISCTDDDTKPNEEMPDKKTITGKLTEIPNPCTTDPCLPGVVTAIETDSLNYIITVNHLWYDREVVINNDTLRVNDSVEAYGSITKKQDLQSQTYYEIEIINLKKL